MKAEAKTRKLLEYLHNLNKQSLDEDEGYNTYTSVFEGSDDGKKPGVFRNEAASLILNNILTAIRTLEWVLEEPITYKYVESEEEARRYKDKILYDGNGKRHIPDTSIEAFIAGLENRY